MKKYIIILIIFFCGGLTGWLLSLYVSEKNSRELSEIRSGGYQYINPLLECELGDALQGNLLKPFKNKVQSVVDQYMQNGSISSAAVYYRDLNNGPTFGIHENDDFAESSESPIDDCLFQARGKQSCNF